MNKIKVVLNLESSSSQHELQSSSVGGYIQGITLVQKYQLQCDRSFCTPKLLHLIFRIPALLLRSLKVYDISLRGVSQSRLHYGTSLQAL